jgi:hypothetical protein
MQTCHFMMTFERAKREVLIHCGQALRLARHAVVGMPSSPKSMSSPARVDLMLSPVVGYFVRFNKLGEVVESPLNSQRPKFRRKDTSRR